MPVFKKFIASVWDVLEVLIIAVVSIYLVYGFIAQPFLVQGASMEPNFQHGNYLIVDEISYRFRAPERGEVIVFRNPNNEAEFYIKRIVGLPGEFVEIRGNDIFIDGVLLQEDYLPKETGLFGSYEFNLKDTEYFVMGDNRAHSFDSRNWGPLQKDNVVGVVRLRFWPLGEFKLFTQ
ncbi:MAG: signal peptidase I [Candidatus Colwellbacteria bacterium]|nr:signal peptidase I [Candidatus Colwellbacteria bacterium]